MHGLAVMFAPAVVSAFDLGSFSKLVDLGGGSGMRKGGCKERKAEERKREQFCFTNQNCLRTKYLIFSPGALVFAACQRYPSLHASLFDLSSVLPFSQKSLLLQSQNSPLIMQRISLIPGNFFQDPLPDADVFVLSRIIHDWDENKASLLLKKVYSKLPKGGALLICEMLLDEDECGPISTLIQSLSIFFFSITL
jgi:hypothetical protein